METSKLDDLIVIVECEDCLTITNWQDCEKHPDTDCYLLKCPACGWSDRLCDTTTYCEITK